MNRSLNALCDALKKIICQLKPQNNALSFLLLTGRDNQGKTTLLRQSNYDHCAVDAEPPADIYYNQQGIILDLGETWLNQSKHLLQYTLKQLNRCHRTLKITGIILCVDINELLLSEPLKWGERSKTHTQLLKRFGQNISHRLDLAIIFTKLDALAGFCEFFQNEHVTDLKKPLGFSLEWGSREGKYRHNFKPKFERYIEVLGQQVIHKMHPARSSIKRTLIREFPLQLASLGQAIQAFIQTISPEHFRLQALYFTSGEQGGISVDRLNQKIKHEYALTVQDTFPQSMNHRAYFIEGALHAFQAHTKHFTAPRALPYQWIRGILTGTVSVSLIWLGVQYIHSSRLLDNTSKELLTYDTLVGHKDSDPTSALYHLTKAASSLDQLTSRSFYLPTVQQLKEQLHTNTKEHLQGNFLPTILSEIEQTIVDTRQPQAARYQALKIYLMLGDPSKFSSQDVVGWFRSHWQDLSQEKQKEKIQLLQQVLRQPFQSMSINHQIVSDVRNYLNALPANYLYYTLAKNHFPTETQPILIEGFDLAAKELPVYFTKPGFQNVLHLIPAISAELQADNWVLARQDLNHLPTLLQQAYYYEYVLFWQNFMRRSTPRHVQTYHQAHELAQALHQTGAIEKLVHLIQQHVGPDTSDSSNVFNQEIASQFTDLSLMSHSAIRELTTNLSELETFLSTLAMITDQGKTIFTLTKARFEGDKLSNPLSALYEKTRQLPEPVSTWAKQIANDTWFMLINDSRHYINEQWQQTVVREYQTKIANRYPFDATQTEEVAIADFDHFFSMNGSLNEFIEQYLKPFIDTSQPQWQSKELNNYVLPFSSEMMNELIRANVITTMFFPEHSRNSQIDFTLQKLSLDPIVANLQLVIGTTQLKDTQDSDSFMQFHWPQPNAKLTLNSIEGHRYELSETGPWAFFKILQKVNVLVDEQDSSNLQILFEVNGNSGRYILKTQNQINPFIPGILNGFTLNDSIA
jgi:intracellular multiplication protein IcmF